MSSKYIIESSTNLVKKIVRIKNIETNEIKEIMVDVDLSNKKIYFTENDSSINYDELEKDILASIEPSIPVMDFSNVFDRIRSTRSTNFESREQ